MPRRLVNFIASHQRWLVVLLLFCMALVNNLDRQTLSVLAPTLRQELGFGPIEYSYIVSAFLAAYTIGYLFAGKVLDHWGVKLGLAAALAFWSLAGALHAVATSWVLLAVFRFLLGLGESFNSPGGVKAIAEWIPARERGLCMAVFSNGNIVGAILAPPLVAFLALHFGWRWAFVLSAFSGVILLVAWWRFYFSPEAHPRVTPAERTLITSFIVRAAPSGPKLSMWALCRNPICIGFFFVRFLTDSWSYFLAFWMPEYLTHSRGFTLTTLGLIGWLPYLAADLGGPSGGAVSDWLVRRGWPPAKARRTLMLIAACVMPLSLVAVRTDHVWLAVVLLGVLYAAQTCWMANQLTLISESVSKENVATLLSLSALGGSLGGIVSNLLTGRAVASVGYVPVFTVFGVLHLLAFGVLILALKWSQRLRRPTSQNAH